MLQSYVGKHSPTQDVAKQVTGAASSTVGNITPLQLPSSGKSVSQIDATYLLSGGTYTGTTGVSGYYIAQLVEPVQGFNELCSICSASASLINLPPDAIFMAFHTYLSLSSAPSVPINDPSFTWFPIPVSSHVVSSTNASVSFEHCFPVENDPNNALYFGVAVLGTFTITPRALFGAWSLRQVTSERTIFMPNK